MFYPKTTFFFYSKSCKTARNTTTFAARGHKKSRNLHEPKPLKNNGPQHVRENTSKAITSTFKAIGLVSVQEVLAKCNFLTTPATAQRCFVLSGHWMRHCVCVCVRVICARVTQVRVGSAGLLLISLQKENERGARLPPSCPSDFQMTETECCKCWQ